MEELNSLEFLRRLRRLRDRLARVLRRLDVSQEGPKGRLPLPELDSHRPYAPGDDPRHIDWNLYARFDRFFVKSMIREEEGLLLLVVDVSRSMRQPHPAKMTLALQVAAALGYLNLCAGNRVCVVPWAERVLRFAHPLHGEAQAGRLVQELCSLPDGTGTDLGHTLTGLIGRGVASRTSAVLISDFLDAGRYRDRVDYLLQRELALGAIQVLDPAEIKFRLQGYVELVEPESGTAVRRVAGYRMRRKLREEVSRFLAGTHQFFSRRCERFVRASTGASFETVVEEYLLSRDSGGGPW